MNPWYTNTGRLLRPLVLFAALLTFVAVAPRDGFVQAARALPAPPATPTARFTVTDLSAAGAGCEAFAISNNGKVAGRCGSGSSAHGFFWENGVMQSLGTLGGSSSQAFGVNDAGQVVGVSLTSSGYQGAFLWQNGSMQNLGTLGGNGPAGALAINNAGQVVGFAINGAQQMRAFRWSGGMADLGALSGGSSYAYGINEAGQVVGWATVGAQWPYNNHAFLYSGGMQDLGTLGWAHSQAMALNDNGQVVGNLANADLNDAHAFLAQGGGMQDLGGSISFAYDINNAGLIVGESGQRAVLWENGALKDLNTLIPADSGWVLLNARGINDRGRIVGKGTFNGQARTFLLKPRAYYWVNPSGGAWHVAANWDPQGDPGDGDTVIFGLSGQYVVDASAVAAAAPATTFPVGRAIISGANTVEFVNLALNLLDDSVDEPALTVSDNGTVKITSGAGSLIHAILGSAPPANPANPPIARLQVFNAGTELNGTGRLTIGDEGAGDLFVANGAHLTSAEARLGGLLAGSNGAAAVGGDGSLWQTGNIAVGYAVSGTLTVENGGRVDSNDAFVSFGILSEDSQVTVDGAGTSRSSLWALLGDLTIGQTWFGSVEVLNGGDLYVSHDVHVKNGELKIDGRRPNGDPSDLDVLGSVFVGGAGSANLLALWNAAKGDIEGNLIIGKDGPGAAILWGAANTAHPTHLEVVDPQAGLCEIGREFDGGVSLDEGGLLRCRTIQLGRVGTSGAGSLTVDGGMVRALDVLQVGQVGGGAGQVDMQNNALVATTGTYIAPNGVVTGTGTLAVGFLGLQNDGTLAPGINLLYPLIAADMSHATSAAATMAISGTLTFGPNARLRIPIAGATPGLYGSLAVTGTVALDGMLALDFRQGYVPQPGDAFTLLTAADGLVGTFASVEIGGLFPGFAYELTIVDGQITLEALNDGIPLYEMFLPVVR